MVTISSGLENEIRFLVAESFNLWNVNKIVRSKWLDNHVVSLSGVLMFINEHPFSMVIKKADDSLAALEKCEAFLMPQEILWCRKNQCQMAQFVCGMWHTHFYPSTSFSQKNQAQTICLLHDVKKTMKKSLQQTSRPKTVCIVKHTG